MSGQRIYLAALRRAINLAPDIGVFLAADDVLSLVEAVEAARAVERSRTSVWTTMDGHEEVDAPSLDALARALAPFVFGDEGPSGDGGTLPA